MNLNLKHLIETEVGDWSNDGHNQSEKYLFRSNKSPKELSVIHKSCKEKLGFDIGDICDEYEEFELDPEIASKLLSLGFTRLDIIKQEEYNEEYYEQFPEEREKFNMSADSVFELWMKILKYLDPSFDYEIVEGKTWQPCGGDGGTPGYGVFWS